MVWTEFRGIVNYGQIGEGGTGVLQIGGLFITFKPPSDGGG